MPELLMPSLLVVRLEVTKQMTTLQFIPLAPELFFFNFSTPVYKMWIIKEPNKLALWNKLHFEEKKMESIEHV